MENYEAGSIAVSNYDPNWPALFEQESIRIKKALGSFASTIAAQQFLVSHRSLSST
jgi:GrpB-like predicted nucleotidyltransferase (UPF0157 family)